MMWRSPQLSHEERRCAFTSVWEREEKKCPRSHPTQAQLLWNAVDDDSLLRIIRPTGRSCTVKKHRADHSASFFFFSRQKKTENTMKLCTCGTFCAKHRRRGKKKMTPYIFKDPLFPLCFWAFWDVLYTCRSQQLKGVLRLLLSSSSKKKNSNTNRTHQSCAAYKKKKERKGNTKNKKERTMIVKKTKRENGGKTTASPRG